MMFFRSNQRSTLLTWTCLMLSQLCLLAASPKSGEKIYRQLCTKCHGPAGEGVKGKYDDVLFGDWSMEKLTRYINKNMPDDSPGKCAGPDAQTVAAYMYDAFYSREARARNHPARVELVRLTNRQYLNTVADLLKHFQGGDAKLTGNEHGLRATFTVGRKGRGEGKPDHLEREVSYDFGTNAPDWAAGTTNGFSMQWRGSVLADETGEYEFTLKTPNGARLWVNNDEEPLIDGSVASGEANEQKASIRLIGGRSYPLRLDMRKEPRDKKSSIVLEWKPPHGAQMLLSGRSLSPERSTPTFVIGTPFPADDSSVGYERGVSISEEWDEAATHAAIEVANFVVKRLDQFSRSKPADADRTTKVEAFCREFVETAFRRPLTAEQQQMFVSGQFKNTKLEDAVKRVVLLSLKSPRFLYLGLEGDQPDDFAVAQRLAFGMYDSLPDRELTKAAASGALHTPEQVSAQARRMLADPRTHAKMHDFLQFWLQMNRTDDLSKDAKLYPGFSPEIISDLRTSLNIFVDDVVWSGASDYRNFLLADYLYFNDRLAKFYGAPTTGTDDFVKVTLNAQDRSGVLTHPYLLAEFSYQKSTSPVHRGVFLTRNIVGRALRPPPMAVAFKDAEFAPNMTMREKVTELTRSESCQTCHSVINPLGFTLEHYDAVGRFRTGENGRPIEAISEYTTDDGKVVRFAGPRDVAKFAIDSDHSKNVFIEQLFHNVAKQPLQAYGLQTMDQLHQSFVTNNFNIQKLLVDIVTVTSRNGLDKTTLAKKKS